MFVLSRGLASHRKGYIVGYSATTLVYTLNISCKQHIDMLK